MTKYYMKVKETMEEGEEMKEGMSVKKKLVIGGGVLLGLVLGAVALGSRKSKNDCEDYYADGIGEFESIDDDAEESNTTENIGDVSDQTAE